MMCNYDKEPKLKVIIDDDIYGTVEMPTKKYVTSALESTAVTLESSIATLEDKINIKMEIQAKDFKCELEERDREIQNLSNELNETSKLITHLIKHGSKTVYCEVIPCQDNPPLRFNTVIYKIKFNFVNDSYEYDEYEFKLDGLQGNDIKLHLCKLKNIGKDRIKVRIKVYDSSNNLIKKLKYIVDIKGKKYIQL